MNNKLLILEIKMDKNNSNNLFKNLRLNYQK
jgi:hypothetical protein